MLLDFLLPICGFIITTAGAALLYLLSENQRLLRKALPRLPVLIAAALLLSAGTAAWVAAWGGLVGGLLALSTWMAVSVGLPYIAARWGVK